ncbi:MAG: HEAT repeat domain-containing protein [Planctomycetota bacterium]|nr:HEAT repeat domain-containing protein [Planctomycetota bacterium]MEC9158731.1 HEAT repeat domain-containing protein [Planctomycetota bacterium]MED5507364.1 HEAT repeat domain-containing protein [Planctomycetota bacterium]
MEDLHIDAAPSPGTGSRPGLVALPGLLLLLGGCASISNDFASLGNAIFPPTGAEAGEWATDFTNPELQQRGLVLLGTAPWAGTEQYQQLYRSCIEGPWDPLVKAAAIKALGSHGDPDDALLIASELENEYPYVRTEAAKSLQRLHDPRVQDTLWQRLVVEEDQGVQIELAIALGQYPSDAVFQALVLELENRELAVNLAAADSLRCLTGVDHGIDAIEWLAWYDANPKPFANEEVYLYPVYTRPLGFLDWINIFNPTIWEKPGLPRGLEVRTVRSTRDGGPAQTQDGS